MAVKHEFGGTRLPPRPFKKRSPDPDHDDMIGAMTYAIRHVFASICVECKREIGKGHTPGCKWADGDETIDVEVEDRTKLLKEGT